MAYRNLAKTDIVTFRFCLEFEIEICNSMFFPREKRENYAIVNYFCLPLSALGGNPATYKDNLLQGERRAL